MQPLGSSGVAPDKDVSTAFVQAEIAGFQKRPTDKLLQNVLVQNEILTAIRDMSVISKQPHVYSHKLDAWSVTNQKSSGRCWIFSYLNFLRQGISFFLSFYSRNHPKDRNKKFSILPVICVLLACV